MHGTGGGDAGGGGGTMGGDGGGGGLGDSGGGRPVAPLSNAQREKSGSAMCCASHLPSLTRHTLRPRSVPSPSSLLYVYEWSHVARSSE